MTLDELDVLIVDDHEAMRALLQRALTKAGVTRLRVATTAAEALEALRAQPANLVLADNHMPGMDGLTFVAAVRADPALGTPKIAIVSGNARVAFSVDAINAGADVVLVKPVSMRDLFAAIERLFAV